MNESKKPYASVGGTELSLWDITKILLAKIHWLLLAGVVVAAGVYAVVTIFVTPTYESRVSFYVYNSADNSSQGTINNSDLQAAESLATTYSKILASNSVLDSVLSDLRAETSLSRKELSRMVNVSVVSDTQLLEVVVTSTNPELACKIANSFAKVAPTEIVRITKAGGVEVVDRPEVATEKSAPRTVFDSAIGFVVGMILASVAIILRMMADTTIYLPEDIEKSAGVTVLGQIPDIHTYQELYPQYAEKIKFYIGDVRDYNSILNAFRGVDYVFHAAALKQVPSCEFYPMEAVKTNVAGSDNVISACVTNHVKKAIFLSTDKAAYPINAMGMTKAVMEKNVIARSRQMLPGDPVLCLTRYGNVMASRGSVIPLFCDQIDEGKPLTITNPNMTRFMMTLSDAVDLVLYAFEHGEQGDLFVQKAPAATIETLAQAVLELKHSNLGTTIIGTRHGEKLFEVLVTAEEMMRAEELPGFFRIPADNRDLNYDNYFSKGNPEFGKIEQYTSHNTHRLNVEEMKQLLLKLKLFGGTC